MTTFQKIANTHITFYAYKPETGSQLYSFSITNIYGVPRLIHKFRLQGFKITAAWLKTRWLNYRLSLDHKFAFRISNYRLFLVKNGIVANDLRLATGWVLVDYKPKRTIQLGWKSIGIETPEIGTEIVIMKPPERGSGIETILYTKDSELLDGTLWLAL